MEEEARRGCTGGLFRILNPRRETMSYSFSVQAVGMMMLIFGAVITGLGFWTWRADRRHPS